MLKNKRILITQPLVRGFNGSTLVTLELAEHFQNLGAKVTVYTCDYAEPAKSHFIKKHFKVDTAQDNPDYKLTDFDYIWVHSQILPISLVRQLSQKLPAKLPTFIFLHMSGMDWIPDEKPWIYDLENRLSSLSLFICEEVREVNKPLLSSSIPTAFFRNPVPANTKPRKTLPHPQLKNLLLVSNHLPEEVWKAREILTQKHQINITTLGENQEKYELFDPSILEKYDAVLTIAKTVPYCLVSGTPVYVYDIYGGGPGWLNDSNFEDAKIRNFSGYQNSQYPNYEGGVFHRKTAEQITKEVIEGYKGSLAYHQKHLPDFANDFTLDSVVPQIFSKLKPRKIAPFSSKYAEAVIAAEQFATIRFEAGGVLFIRDERIRSLEKQHRDLTETKNRLTFENQNLTKDLQDLQNSRAYKLFDKIITPYKKIKERNNHAK